MENLNIEPNTYSYKDSAARVVNHDGTFYRYIFPDYKDDYDHLMSSGLYNELVQKNLLLTHKEVSDKEISGVYKVLLPEQIAFQSYPFEWSYGQWRKAALACLEINTIALRFGMILKDATPYNFFLKGGKAILLDTSSFIKFNEPDYWIAYRQFCEEFFGPITLMHYRGHRWARLTMAALRGLPLDFISKQLPIKSWLNISCLTHIHLHSKTTNSANKSNESNKGGFSKEKLTELFRLLNSTIKDWNNCFTYPNHWVNYYEKDIESQEYLKEKEEIVEKWLKEIKPKTVLDLGANTGKFTEIASKYANRVVALEYDEICVDQIENFIENQKLENVFTLVGNLTETSPNLGLLGREHASIFERAKSDCVMGLALTHHLLLPGMLPLELLPEIFNFSTNKYLILEFIDESDSKVQILKKTNHKYYPSEKEFEFALKGNFKTIDSKKFNGANRKVYFLEKC